MLVAGALRSCLANADVEVVGSAGMLPSKRQSCEPALAVSRADVLRVCLPTRFASSPRPVRQARGDILTASLCVSLCGYSVQEVHYE
jgi:hypothetical protein